MSTQERAWWPEWCDGNCTILFEGGDQAEREISRQSTLWRTIGAAANPHQYLLGWFSHAWGAALRQSPPPGGAPAHAWIWKSKVGSCTHRSEPAQRSFAGWGWLSPLWRLRLFLWRRLLVGADAQRSAHRPGISHDPVSVERSTTNRRYAGRSALSSPPCTPASRRSPGRSHMPVSCEPETRREPGSWGLCLQDADGTGFSDSRMRWG